MAQGKHTILYVRDQRPPNAVGGAVPIADPVSSPPAVSAPPPPTQLRLSTGVEFIAAAYLSYIDARWLAPDDYAPSRYELELTSYDADGVTVLGVEQLFADHSVSQALDDVPQSRHLPRLRAATRYGVRVRALNVAGQPSPWLGPQTITTADDSVPPAAVTGIRADWTTGTLDSSWTPPADADLKDYLVEIWDAPAMNVRYASYIVAAPRFAWTPALNRIARGGTITTSAYLAVQARDQRNNLSPRVGLSATNAAPGSVSGVRTTWDADAGLADEDLVIACTLPTMGDFASLRYTIDGKTYSHTGTSFTYTLAQNRSDHGGTPAASISFSIQVIDELEQVGPAFTAGIINRPPPLPTGFTESWGARPTAGPNLVLTYALPQINDLDYVAVEIDGTLYRWHDTTFTYDLAANRRDHGGTASPSLSIRLWYVDRLGQAGAFIRATATNPPPNPPTSVVTSWDGDTGLAGADFSATWLQENTPDFSHFRVTAQGLEQPPITARAWTLAFDQNKALTGGPFASLTLTLQTVDVFNQASTAITLTRTNVAPPVPLTTDIRLTPVFGFADVKVFGLSPTAKDSARFEFTLYRSSSPILTLLAGSPSVLISVPSAGFYRVGVRHFDAFNQANAEVLTGLVEIDSLSLEELREDITYSDDLGTSPATLKASLANNFFLSGGITYR